MCTQAVSVSLASQQVSGADVMNFHLFLVLCILMRNLILETWPLGLEKANQWLILCLIKTDPPPSEGR